MGQQQDFQDQIDAARKAFKPQYRKGDDYQNKGDDHGTFGIDVAEFDQMKMHYGRATPDFPASWWGNKICVFGDEALRDLILAKLQEPPNA